MYRIAICDDEEVFAQAHERLCRDICTKLGIAHQVSVFSHSEDLARAITAESKPYDLILLDIIMPQPDGMALAAKIRETDRQAALVFITSSRDYLAQGYDVRALHYLEKPVNEDKLEALIAADHAERFQKLYVMFESDEGIHKTDIRDIICMETAGRRVQVTLPDRTVFFPGKLSQLLAELPHNRFVRCHQAFAVNIAQIRELTKKDVIAVTGKLVPVSRNYAASVKKAFAEYLRRC